MASPYAPRNEWLSLTMNEPGSLSFSTAMANQKVNMGRKQWKAKVKITFILKEEEKKKKLYTEVYYTLTGGRLVFCSKANIYLGLWKCRACTRTWTCPEQTSQCHAYCQNLWGTNQSLALSFRMVMMGKMRRKDQTDSQSLDRWWIGIIFSLTQMIKHVKLMAFIVNDTLLKFTENIFYALSGQTLFFFLILFHLTLSFTVFYMRNCTKRFYLGHSS